jgi:hypothetical protein
VSSLVSFLVFDVVGAVVGVSSQVSALDFFLGSASLYFLFCGVFLVRVFVGDLACVLVGDLACVLVGDLACILVGWSCSVFRRSYNVVYMACLVCFFFSFILFYFILP